MYRSICLRICYYSYSEKNKVVYTWRGTNARAWYNNKLFGEGAIIEDYPTDFLHPSCLIFGHTLDKRIIHVVAGGDKEYVYIITAYYPSIDKFEKDMKTRKAR